jgi:hypothetical protein
MMSPTRRLKLIALSDETPKEKPAEWIPLGGLSVALRRLLRHRDVEAEQVPAVSVLAGGGVPSRLVPAIGTTKTSGCTRTSGRPHEMSPREART